MGKKRREIIYLEDKVFQHKVNLLLGYSLDEAIDIVEYHTKDKIEIDQSETFGFSYAGTNNIYFLWLPKDCKRKTIMHETFHMISTMLRGKNIEHTKETEEVYAYVWQYWYREILKLMKIKDE